MDPIVNIYTLVFLVVVVSTGASFLTSITLALLIYLVKAALVELK